MKKKSPTCLYDGEPHIKHQYQPLYCVPKKVLVDILRTYKQSQLLPEKSFLIGYFLIKYVLNVYVKFSILQLLES